MNQITDLDRAWAAINALGGTAPVDDEYAKGFVEAIGAALQTLEEFGATDAAWRASSTGKSAREAHITTTG